jgi:transcriptional regulator with XRE-family HTH domain
MTLMPDEQRRAGRAVADRMAELGMSVAELAEKAGVDPTTVRAFLAGRRWPHASTRAKVARALGWKLGDAARAAFQEQSLAHIPTRELVRELCRRLDRDDVA